MKIAIFGGTGRTGQHVIRQALAAKQDVVALARTPASIAGHNSRLQVIQGDIRNSADVERVIAGADAVLSVLGPGSNQPEFAVSKGTQHILDAMKAHGVRRLVISSGAGVPDPLDEPTLFHKAISLMVRLLSKNVYEDMRRTVELVRASDADWTVVRVPMLTDGPATGRVRVGYMGKGTGARLSRADLAAFMLGQLDDPTYRHRAPVISN